MPMTGQYTSLFDFWRVESPTGIEQKPGRCRALAAKGAPMAFPVSDEKIVDAEMVLGRRLPEPIRARLGRENGGTVSAAGEDWLLYPVRDASDRKRLSRTANDIFTETKKAREWSGFPPSAIALASNGSGDLLILQPGSNHVFLWDHEQDSVCPVSVEWEKE